MDSILKQWWGVIALPFVAAFLYWSASSDRTAEIRSAYNQCRVTDGEALCGCYREGLEAQLSVLDYFTILKNFRQSPADKIGGVMGYCIGRG